MPGFLFTLWRSASRLLLAAAAFAVSGGAVAANASALPPTPPPLASPVVHANRTVTFSIFEPGAKLMSLSMGLERPVPMTEDKDGVWSVTVGPLAPDYYDYVFVRGKPLHPPSKADTPWNYNLPAHFVLDPKNPDVLPNFMQPENIVHVPGPVATTPWEMSDVPHGVVSFHIYHSAVMNDERGFYVYTPPGYNPRGKEKYPVLYLLHGFAQMPSNWIYVLRANVIMDNLIAEHKAKPMILVMPLAYGGYHILVPGAYWKDHVRDRNFARLTRGLFTEVMPRVDRDYNVRTGPGNTAIAGLSMGAAQSLLIGLNHPDRFAWVGAWSAGGLPTNFSPQFPEVNRSTNSKRKLLWISCGEQDMGLIFTQDLEKWLKSEGVKYTGVTLPGRHTWMTWRRNLAAMTPLLFR